VAEAIKLVCFCLAHNWYCVIKTNDAH
jgi:hypothetical protein